MLDRIHHSRIIDILERREEGRPVEFSIEYCKKSTGELVTYPAAVLTSFHSDGKTINILPVGKEQPRKLRRCLITKINNLKVYF